MPDVCYSYHIPKYSQDTDEGVGGYGTIQVISNANTVEVGRFDKNHEPQDPMALDFDTWDTDLRAMNMVVTPLITRGGVCVCLDLGGGESTQKTLGCLVKYQENNSYFNGSTCHYQALMTADMDVAQIFFLDLFKHAMVPIGEVVYLDISVLPEEGFRVQGGGGKLLYTRLAPPNVHEPEEGKLYVMGLYQPHGRRGVGEVSASPITFAVNPWDIQLASDYTGNPSNILKRLR
jgi:hypothetical protein